MEMDDRHVNTDEGRDKQQERLRMQQSVRFAAFETDVATPSAPPLLTSSSASGNRTIKSVLKHSVSSSSAASGSTDSGFAGSAFADNDGEPDSLISKLLLSRDQNTLFTSMR